MPFLQAMVITVVDRTDFAEDEKLFGNVWGVADEYLFLRSMREADKSYQAQKTVFLYYYDYNQSSSVHLSRRTC